MTSEELQRGVTASTRVIAVASGKGGVGKTSFSIGITAAISRLGYRVALQDLDIRAPNIPVVLGMDMSLSVDRNGCFYPKEKELGGKLPVQVFSSGFLFNPGDGITIDGAMVTELVKNCLRGCRWGPVDVLIVDMDPSSGDAIRALCELQKNIDLIIVAESDASAISDCERMVDSVRVLRAETDSNIRIAGVVSNRNGIVCPCCGKDAFCKECETRLIYGHEGVVKDLAVRNSLPYLGGLPMDARYREDPVRAIQAENIGKPFFDSILAQMGFGGVIVGTHS